MGETVEQLITLGGKTIGNGCPLFFIAEIGVNHNGSLELAHNLIAAASEAGAQAVKFQTFSADRIVTETSPKANYQRKNTDAMQSQYEMLKALEIPESWYPELTAHCADLGLDFISTPYDIEDVNFLQKLNVCSYKIPSAWVVDLEYIDAIARIKKPVFMATGMCTMNEVARAVDVIKKYTDQLVLLQCTTDYPTKTSECNVRAMKTLADTFGCLSGLSDHSNSHLPAILAVALGAVIIERHFTLDKALPGPDHSSSDTPVELAALIHSLNQAQVMLGSAEKRPSGSEYANLAAMRRSLVAAKPLQAGTVLKSADVGLKRPAGGIEPCFLADVIGKTLTQDVAAHEQLRYAGIDMGDTCCLFLDQLRPTLEPDVSRMFSVIASSEDVKMFHPHAFDSETAVSLCNYPGRDYYALVKCNGVVAGYAMLRGWEEGYTIPTAGLYVFPEWRGKRLASNILSMLEIEAKQRSASMIMAKVYRHNTPSLRSFLRAGYKITKEDQGVMFLHAYLK